MNQEEANAIPPLNDGVIVQLSPNAHYRMKLRDESKDEWDNDRTLELRAEVSHSDRILMIGAKGYGEFSCPDNAPAFPIVIEYHNGSLRVLIWGDINQEDPTHTIDLSGALESNREDE